MSKHNLEFVQKELNDLIDEFTIERDRHKGTALYLKLVTTFLAALSMVLLGWENPPAAAVFKNCALVFNACIGLFAAYEAFFEPKKLWVRETMLLCRLKDVRRDLDYQLSKENVVPDKDLDRYKQKIDDLLNEGLAAWARDRAVSGQ